MGEFSEGPQSPDRLQRTLDPTLIAAHGRATLYQALDEGSLVCFVGSGISMTYGRLSWGQLVEMLNATTIHDASTAEGRASKLLSELGLTSREQGDELKSDRYPAAFQYLEDIARASRPGAEGGDSAFRRRVREFVYDDKGQIYVIWEALLNELKPSADETCPQFNAARKALQDWAPELAASSSQMKKLEWKAARLPPKETDRGDPRRFDGLFRVDPQKIARWSAARPDASELIGRLEQVLWRCLAAQGSTGASLPPLRRFALAALWRLLPPIRVARETRVAVGRKPRGARQGQPSLDPLLILARDLRVRRFLTTNYDLDIERMLLARGFKPLPADARPSDSRQTLSETGIGEMSSDTVFSIDRATELIEFAVEAPQHRAFQVMHLHGRATADTNMIVTERDYMEQYLGKGPSSEVVADALDLAFHANTLLFVGSGMGEDDVIHPLRQFISERTSRHDRSAVVLLPASKSRARQIEESIALYARYGVLTIHFGIGPWCGDSQEVRWLAFLVRLSKHLGRLFGAFLGCVQEPNGSNAGSKPGAASNVDDQFLKVKTELRSFELFGPAGDQSQDAQHLACMISWGADGKPPSVTEPARLAASLADGAVACSLDFERGVLNSCIEVAHRLCAALGLGLAAEWQRVRVSRDSPRPPDGTFGDRLQRETDLPKVLKSARALARGLEDALTAAALGIALTQLRENWEASRRNKIERPRCRSIGGWRKNMAPQLPFDATRRSRVAKSESFEGEHDVIPLCARHSVVLTVRPAGTHAGGQHPLKSREPRPDEAPAGDRFFGGAPSQTFLTWYEAIRAARENDQSSPRSSSLAMPFDRTGRRLFVFLAPRGVGKGHFFEALKTERRTGEFIRFSWPRVPIEVARTRYAGFMFFNLSFSLEVISAFDRLTAWLCERASTVFKDEIGDDAKKIHVGILAAYRRLKFDRIGRLREMLRLYDRYAAQSTSRLYVAFSGFGNLFDERGYPKNAELCRVVTALLGEDCAQAPIDVSVVCTESAFPILFTEPDSSEKRLQNSSLQSWRDLPRLPLEWLGLEGADAKRRSQLSAVQKHLRVNLLDAQRPAPRSSHRLRERRPANFFHVLQEARASNTVAKYFPDVALAVALGTAACPNWERKLETQVRETASPLRVTFAPANGPQAIADVIFKLSKDYPTAGKMVADVPVALEYLARNLKVGKGTVTELTPAVVGRAFKNIKKPEEMKSAGHSLDDSFGMIADLTCRSRFLLSLCCAVASELAWSTGRTEAGRASPALSVLPVLNWFRLLRNRISSDSSPTREDRIIGCVLEEFQRLHEEGIAPHQAGQEAHGSRDSMTPLLNTVDGWQLQQRLLWHLAIVGQPVEADVLASSPEIIRLGAQMLGIAGTQAPEAQTERLVEAALDLMVRRCMVFRINNFSVVSEEALIDDPDAKLAKQSASGWRFALHRFMQRAIFLRLHAPFVEHSHVDQFGLSMWVTQPDDLPRPNRFAVGEIDAVVAAWAGAESAASDWKASQRFIDAMESARAANTTSSTLACRMLRAAFGIVRSVFSVGVISRFHDFEDGDRSKTWGDGYFEQHRQKVEWLIRRGTELATLSGDPAGAPFYAEEIVWLYNECGLFYLVEGRLNLAAAQFDLALAAARRLEPRNGRGALWCRIHMNLAVVDIERGKLRDARRYLTEIRDIADENPILRVLAQGCLARVEHHSGNLKVAEALYLDVIDDLDTFGQSRSVAIFSRNLGDLYRARRNGNDAADAHRFFDRSIAAAMKGGHEDVRQLARLSRIRHIIKESGGASPDIQADLDEIERYGQIMDMPRVIADVAYARGSHLLCLGETRYATTLARRAIALATANGLKLRQMTSLMLLARIYNRRGLHEAARVILNRALAMAEGSDYVNVRQPPI